MRALLRGLLLTAMTLLSSAALAHEMSMAEMQVRELTRGEFLWQWSAGEKRAPADVLKPVWPAGCIATGNRLRCTQAGLDGTLAVEGVGKAF